MTNLFKGPKTDIPEPRVVRMPNEDDKSILEAANRRRRSARSRTGRRSTILTDQGVTGSSGRSLGA